jgi:hypothetical protein
VMETTRCCDPLVSLQAMTLGVNRQSDTVSTVDGVHGLLPFHFAAMWDASLDVVYNLLKHCPHALHHLGNTSSATSADSTSSSANDDGDDSQQRKAGFAAAAVYGPPVKKKAKMSS